MGKRDLRESFHELLEIKKQAIAEHRRRGRDEAAFVASEVSGIAYAMYKLGLIDREQRNYIAREAADLAEGKVDEYEAC